MGSSSLSNKLAMKSSAFARESNQSMQSMQDSENQYTKIQ